MAVTHVTAAPRRTRIIQFSDLHLTAHAHRRVLRTDVWAGLQRALAALQDLEPFDRLVLTGDLANWPLAAAYVQLGAAVAPWRERLRAIPGNHDARRPLHRVFADRLLAERDAFVDAVGGWRLIGLDSKRTLRIHGRLGDEQLRWLAALLAADRSPTLLFLHHPVMRVGTWWLDRDVVRDAERLAAVVSGSSVRAIFCGHVHQEFEGSFAGVPFHSCPSTAYQFVPGSRLPAAIAMRAPAFRVIDTEADAFTTRVVRLPVA